MERVVRFLSILMLMAVYALSTASVYAQDEGPSRMAVIIDTTCDAALHDEGLFTISWPLNDIEGKSIGLGSYPDPSTVGITTNIRASFSELTSEPRGIAIYEFPDGSSELTMAACGDIESLSPAAPEWTIELAEQNDSGLKGLAVLGQGASDELAVTLYIWMLNGMESGNSGVAEGISDDELSGPGGIGNTREDVLAFWDIGSGKDPVGEFTEDHFHYVTYDLPDYQLSFMFQLQTDDELRSTDRVVDIIVGFISYADRAEADQMVNGWLPDDAEKVGPIENNNIGEVIQKYQSETMAGAVFDIDHPGFEQPGGIWVTYWPADSSVGVIEISLFHPRSE